MTLTLNIPTTDMNYTDIQTLLFKFNELRNSRTQIGYPCDIQFDFQNCSFFVSELSTLLYVMKVQLEREMNTVKFINMSSGLQRVFSKNQFNNIGNPFSNTNSTVIPLFHGYSSSTLQIFDYLHNNVFGNRNWPSKLDESNEIEAINSAIYEISLNIQEHSGSNYIYMCGQFYPQKEELSFTILDEGIGIPFNLKEHIESLSSKSDGELIEWATKRGNSTKSNIASGLGLFDIKSNLTDNGEMTIVSNNGFWYLDADGSTQISNISNPLSGTLIHLKFLLNNTKIPNITYNNNAPIIF